MAAPTRARILSIYKQLLQESKKVEDYNFRMYALRRTRDAFRENKNVTGTAQLQQLLEKASQNLDVLKRQVIIGNLFGSGKLVIESSSQKVGTTRV